MALWTFFLPLIFIRRKKTRRPHPAAGIMYNVYLYQFTMSMTFQANSAVWMNEINPLNCCWAEEFPMSICIDDQSKWNPPSNRRQQTAMRFAADDIENNSYSEYVAIQGTSYDYRIPRVKNKSLICDCWTVSQSKSTRRHISDEIRAGLERGNHVVMNGCVALGAPNWENKRALYCERKADGLKFRKCSWRNCVCSTCLDLSWKFKPAVRPQNSSPSKAPTFMRRVELTRPPPNDFYYPIWLDFIRNIFSKYLAATDRPIVLHRSSVNILWLTRHVFRNGIVEYLCHHLVQRLFWGSLHMHMSFILNRPGILYLPFSLQQSKTKC